MERDLEVLLLAEREERSLGQRKREARRAFIAMLAGRLEQYEISASPARSDSAESPFMRVVKLAFEAAGIQNADPYRLVADAVSRFKAQTKNPLELMTDAERKVVAPELAKEEKRRREIATKNRQGRRAQLHDK
ncbi:MAG TPA: hypothetical protein PKY91_13370 [Rhodocyclaceae bacterium]|nr:hypothetical protein [Rhodocyclaceae bacterium]